MSVSNHKKSGPGAHPEATQFIQAQAGCVKSLNQLMARHDRLVQAVVRQQVLGDLPFEDALHAGRIGLWRAILGLHWPLACDPGVRPRAGLRFLQLRLEKY